MDYAVVAFREGGGGNEKFRCIAEGGVEEGTDGLIGVGGDFFGYVRESLQYRVVSYSYGYYGYCIVFYL